MELTDKIIKALSSIDLISNDVICSYLKIGDDIEKIKTRAYLSFRAKELNIKEEFNQVMKAYEKEDKKIDDEYKTNKIRAVTDAKGDLYQREYIYFDKNSYKVSIPILAEYIKDNLKYIFARSDIKAGIQRYVYEKGVYRHVSDNEFKGYIKNEIPLELQLPKYINDTFSLLICDTAFHTKIELLNADENIINFQNGLLYLDIMELKPHTPDALTTIQIPCDYNPNTTAPKNSVFDKFINHLCYGDVDRVQFLLEFMGVALSNIAGHRMKKALFMPGTGDTGKSQCKELLNRLIGKEHFTSIELADLEERFGASSLYGKRVGGSNDMKYITINQLGAFKSLTGGDNIRVEYKGENGFDFIYRGVLWFCMNELPKFGGDHGKWVYERMIILECNNPVPKKDPFLLDKMYAEREYIVNECMKAVKKVINNGYIFDIPECCQLAKEQFTVENDSVLRFLKECTEPRKDEKYNRTPTTGQVYAVYKAWCKDNVTKGYVETMPAFRKILQSEGYDDVDRIGGNSYYTKIILTYEVKMQYSVYDATNQ